MKPPSKKRQAELIADKDAVEMLYRRACDEFGKEQTDKDLTRLWDLRCILGMRRVIPFGSMAGHTLGDLLWVAEEVCGLPFAARSIQPGSQS